MTAIRASSLLTWRDSCIDTRDDAEGASELGRDWTGKGGATFGASGRGRAGPGAAVGAK